MKKKIGAMWRFWVFRKKKSAYQNGESSGCNGRERETRVLRSLYCNYFF